MLFIRESGLALTAHYQIASSVFDLPAMTVSSLQLFCRERKPTARPTDP